MEKDSMQQDELIRLFASNLTFAQAAPAPAPAQQCEEPSHQPITYISQHYTQTAHLQRPQASSAPATPTPILSHTEQILLEHAIDPSCLLPSQLALFTNAAPEQQVRLLELWRISPPRYSGNKDLARSLNGSWPPTSLEQEEHMARLRWERTHGQHDGPTTPTSAAKFNFNNQQQQQNPSGSTTSEPPSLLASPTSTVRSEPDPAEPYMLSGYEELAKREYEASVAAPFAYNHALDPVYDKRREMEDRYGRMMEARERGCSFADADEMDMML